MLVRVLVALAVTMFVQILAVPVHVLLTVLMTVVIDALELVQQ